MNIYWIFFVGLINMLIISISLTYFLIKGYHHIILEHILKDSNKNVESPETEPLLKDYISKLLNKFNISFIILETSLILYFVFWGILFYLKLK